MITLTSDNLEDAAGVAAALAQFPGAGVILVDADLRVRAIDGDAYRRRGIQVAHYRGRLLRDVLPLETWRVLEPRYRRALAGEAQAFDYDAAGGASYEVQMRPLADPAGDTVGVLVLAQDLGARKREWSEQLERRAAQHAAVAALGQQALAGGTFLELADAAVGALQVTLAVQHATLSLLASDKRTVDIVASAGWSTGQQLPARGRRSQAAFTLSTGVPSVVEDVDTERRFDTRFLRSHDLRSGVTVIVDGEDGPLGVLQVHSINPRDFDHDDVAFLQSMANVLSHAHARETGRRELERVAEHDALTGLPNRAHVEARLAEMDPADELAVLFIDVDHFKQVNDALGHGAGDTLLVTLAERLRSRIREGDVAARFGGDEFVVVSRGADRVAARRMGQRLLRAAAQPVRLGDGDHHMSISIGIAHGTVAAAQDLIRDADIALFEAKGAGRGRLRVFEPGHRAPVVRTFLIERELRRTLGAGELDLSYQPVFSLRGSPLPRVETLVRWTHERRGAISPAEFIPVAERSDLILELDAWVLEQACTQAAQWLRDGALEDVRISVNVSARHLTSGRLVPNVRRALAATRLVPDRLVLEITETALISHAARARRALEQVRRLGVLIALDDFGTGYSSLTSLREFPMDAVKLDRSFVAQIDRDRRTEAIVAGMYGMARALGVTVVAEGIEREGQLEHVRRLGGDLVQGFLLSRPVDAAELPAAVVQPAARFGASPQSCSSR